MNYWKWITPFAIILGLASGPYALSVSKASQPPIDWDHITFMFFGSVISVFWIVGIQLIRKKPNNSQSMMKFFALVSAFTLGSGLGALATGYYYNDFSPANTLFATIGLGLIIGMFLMRLVIHARYKIAL